MKSILNFSALLLLITLSLLAPTLTFAGGNEVGNGGNVVMCKTSAQVLDLYEAEILRGLKPDLNLLDPKKDAFINAENILNSLKNIDPKSSKIILNGLVQIKTDLSFETEIEVGAIDDSLHGFKPKDASCRVQQFVILRKHPLPGEKRILIDKNIWDKLDLMNRTAILLHESIYEYLANLGEKDSRSTRYLVSYFLSKNSISAQGNEYWQLIKKLRLPIYR